MANRVNVKFVVILSAVLLVISAGVALLAMQVVLKSADDHIRLGDTAMQAGDYRIAASHYAKAVADDQQNKDYLRKWIGALELNVPENEQLLNEKFFRDLVPAYNALANADPNGTEDQLEYLNLRLDILERLGGAYRASEYQGLVDDADRYVEHYERVRSSDSAWLPLKRFESIVTSKAARAGTAPALETVDAGIEAGRAALQADPNDERAAHAVYELLVHKADVLEREQLPGAIEARQAVDVFVTESIEATGAGTVAQMSAESTRLANGVRSILGELRRSTTAERAAIEMGPRVRELTPALDALFDRIESSDTPPTTWLLRRLSNLESGIDPSSRLSRSLGVVDATLAKRPGDAELLKLRGVLQTATGRVEEAIETYEEIGQLPSEAITIESIIRGELRDDSLYRLAELYYTQADGLEPGQARQSMLAEVRTVRDRLAEEVASDDPRLRLIDARIALTDDRVVQAQELLKRLNEQTQFRFEEGLWLAGAAAAQNNQPGLARERFGQLVELDRRNVRYRRALAQIEQNLGNVEAAMEQLRVALELEPTNPEISELLQQLETARGIREADDPVDAALFEARRLSAGSTERVADPAAAIARLEQAVNELGPDPRLIANLARQSVLAGNIERAQELASQGLAANPDNAEMQLLNDAVESGDRAQIIEVFLDQLEGEPGEVEVAKAMTLERLGEADAAAAAWERAIEIAPDNAAVLEMRLVRANRAEDFEEADRVASRAAAVDADGTGGATYRARVLQAQGRSDEAISLLREATTRYPNSAALWRLLGVTHAASGNRTDALNAFNRALDIRPNLVSVINAKIRMLRALGRSQDALDFKRANEFAGRTDPDFVELHLQLEGEVGDRGLAIAQRRQRAALAPDEVPNLAQLADLLIDASAFDDAEAIIAQLEEKVEDSRSLTPLRAMLQFERGDVEGARSLFARDIAARTPAERAEAYLRLYEFLTERGRRSEGVTALVQALPWQQPERMLVDRVLGDVFMSTGRFAEANASYTRIRESGIPDPGSVWEQRRIETLIRLGQLDAGAEALSALPEADRTLATELLAADLEMRRGNDAQARSLLDAIIADHPDSALAYVKRAEAMNNVPELQRERIRDLDKAIDLSPNFWQAYRARAAVLATQDRTDEAIVDLRKAIQINPRLDEVRLNLIEYLLTQNRATEALEIAREAMSRKPRDAQLRDRLGLAFAQSDRRRDAAQMYRSALEIEPTPARAVRVLDLLLNDSPPRTIEAENLLALPMMSELIEQDGGLRLMRARVFHLQGRSDAALREAVEAYRSLRPIARDMLVWFNFIEGMIEDRAATLEFLDRFEAEPGTSEWAKLFRGILLLGGDNTRDNGKRMLASHAETTADSEVAFTAWRALGARAYEESAFELAIEHWEKAREKRPNDTTVLNNLAFTYTIRLGDAASGLPLAELAATRMPGDSDILHTLGVSQLRAGRVDESITTLARAQTAAQAPSEWVTASIHLAEALAAADRADDARTVVEGVQSRLNDPSNLNDVLREDYARVLATLGMD